MIFRLHAFVLLLAVSLIAVPGCGPHDDSDDDGDPASGFIASQPWANIQQNPEFFIFHPMGYFGATAQPAMQGRFVALTDPETTCPVIVDNSTQTTIDMQLTGNGCTYDSNTPELDDDYIFNGFAHIVGDATNITITSQNFSVGLYDEDCPSQPFTLLGNGSLSQLVEGNDVLIDEVGTMQVTVAVGDQCTPNSQTIGVDAGGTVIGGAIFPEEVIYNLSGNVAVSGSGRWSFASNDLLHSTSDMTTDGQDNCNEPISGSLSIRSDGDVAEVFPDATTMCTWESCAPMSLNGDPRGEVCGLYGP